MYICVCKAVSDSKIKELVNEGAKMGDIQAKCLAGTSCGTCVPSIRQIIKQEK